MKAIFFISFFSLSAEELNLKVSLEKKKISLDENLVLKVILENSPSDEVIINSTTIKNLGRFSYQQKIVFRNGQLVKQKILHYNLQPKKEGILNFSVQVGEKKQGPFEVLVENNQKKISRTLNNNQIKKLATKPANFFIRNFPNKKKYLINEIGILKTYLYFTEIPNLISAKEQQIHVGLNMIPLEIEVKPFEEEVINNVTYKKKVIDKYLFYPYLSGNLEIEGGSFEVIHQKSLFSDLERINLPVPNTKVQVLSYADDFRKRNWGDFKIDYELSNRKVELDSPIKLVVKIFGEGNFNTLNTFDLALANNELSYQLANVINDFNLIDNNFKGSKSFEYYIFGNQTGTYILPFLELTSYSPTQKRTISIKKELPAITFVSNKNSFSLNEEYSSSSTKTHLKENEVKNNIGLKNNLLPKSLGSLSLLNLLLYGLGFLFIFFLVSFFFFKSSQGRGRKKKTKNLLREFESRIEKISLNSNKQNSDKYREIVDFLKEYLNNFQSKENNKKVKAKNFSEQNLSLKNSYIKVFCLNKIELFEKKIHSNSRLNSFEEDVKKTIAEWHSLVG